MLENTNVQEISNAIFVLRELNADENMRRIAEMREKALHDEANAINSAEEKGRAEGRTEGAIDKAVKVVKNLLAKGFTLEETLAVADIDRETYEKNCHEV